MTTFSRLRFAALAALLAGLVAPDARAQDTWRLHLESVTVDRARESGGDRPYFMTIAFQSRLFDRRSTRVELYEREPHDWVSKTEHRSGRTLRLGDHMSAGETLPIPEWMGLHEYDPVEMTSLAPPARTALRAPIMGAIIIALDNNNTPPHVMRNVGETLRDWTEEFLEEQVETGQILGPVTGEGGQQVFRDSLEAFAERAAWRLDVGRVLETLFGGIVGPLGSPDKLVGMHFLLFPAISDLPADEPETGRFSVPILGERVEWTSLVERPGATFSRSLVFDGSGARYRVRARLSRSRVSGSERVRLLTLRILTGDDDLREGSRVRAAALDARGRVLGESDLNLGRRWEDRSTHTATISLRELTAVSDIARVRLTFTSGDGMSSDDWEMDMLTVYTSPSSPPLVSRQGRPLMRFTNDDRTFEIALR